MSVLQQLDNMILIQFLRHSEKVNDIEPQTYNWELLIRQARHANLLSRIAILLSESTIFDQIPAPPKQHLLNAIKVARAHETSARWEVKDIYRVLKHHNISFILLKGSAYLWTESPASKGRLFGDTDILVKKTDIKAAERALVHNGWVTTKLDNYDQHYYRDWMHEIPPLHHTSRHTTLDVHHTIIPPIIKTGFKINQFWIDTNIDQNNPGLHTLSLSDMILHSACHLFHEGEFEHGLRDLVDLDQLLKQYKVENLDWDQLAVRARRLDLSKFLFYALSYCKRILRTPVPNDVVEQVFRDTGAHNVKSWLLDRLYLRVLAPAHASCKLPGQSIASIILLTRSHWVKMPLHLLIPHLLKKSIRKQRK